MKIVVYNLGCKVNQCECDSITASLKKAGHIVTDEMSFADAYIINTCAVTKEAERKSRQFVGKAHKFNPAADIYVIGCAAEKNAEQFALKNVHYISGTANKNAVLDFPCGTNVTEMPAKYESMAFGENFRARAYVKIEDGCNNFCSYCIIPYLRGRCRSRDQADIIAEVENYAKTTDEIVLTGINISAYGQDTDTSLAELIRSLADISARIRLGSLEVNVIDDNLLTACKEAGNVCPHFHLSLQSGSDEVLKAMNRHYTSQEFYEKVALIRSYFPSASITTDIIVGYPVENDEFFEQTVEFARKVAFSNIHVFPYSRRSGTVGYALGELNAQILKERAEKLAQVKNELKRDYESTFVGMELKVVVENMDGIFAEGYSENYIRVYIPMGNKDFIIGKTYSVIIEREYADGLLAREL